MTMFNEICDPEKILTPIEAKLITPIEYNILKEKAKEERNKILKNITKTNGNDPFMENHIIQFIMSLKINSKEYEELPVLRKEIILANAILSEDTDIIDLLIESGFTYEHLDAIVRYRKLLKDRIIYNITETKEELEKNKIYIKWVSKIIELFKSRFNIDNPTIILNRICEMLHTVSKNKFEEIGLTKENSPSR